MTSPQPSIMSTSQNYWSEGDLCVYKSDSSDQYVLGTIRQVDATNAVCTVSCSPLEGDRLISTKDLLSLTPKTVRLVPNSEARDDALERIDNTFFSQKLEKLENLTSTAPVNVTPKSEVKIKSGRTGSWKAGDMCICMWSEDQNYYYASVTEANHEGNSFLVSFCYYNNVETKQLSELHELGSEFELLVGDDYNKTAAEKMRKYGNQLGKSPKENEIKNLAEECATGLILNANENEQPTIADTPDIMSSNSKVSSKLASSKTDKKRTSRTGKANHHQQQQQQQATTGSSTTAPQTSSSGVAPPADYMFTNMMPDLASLSTLKLPMRSELLGDAQSPWQALLISWFMCGYHTGYYEALHSGEKPEDG
ncbi:unnamed protein product [Calicophoron daubneyi]|uniref:Tudor domain-containing protein n=1 Tax=Calicophoron daubneyi TaxID=300641 RepID=A0AAV2TKT3_CALDB